MTSSVPAELFTETARSPSQVTASPVYMHVQAVSTAQTERSTPHGQKVVVHPDGHAMHDVAVAPHGRLFATSSTIGHVAMWDVDTGMHVRTLQDKRGVGPVLSLIHI